MTWIERETHKGSEAPKPSKSDQKNNRTCAHDHPAVRIIRVWINPVIPLHRSPDMFPGALTLAAALLLIAATPNEPVELNLLWSDDTGG